MAVAKFLSQVLFVAKVEVECLWRYPKLMLATAVITLVPAMYSLIYLSSVWDPDAHTRSLRVALVNLDQGTTYYGQQINVGREIINRLKAQNRFGFLDYSSEEDAREMVRQGMLAFAVIIPPDLSVNAVPGLRKGAGKPVIYASEGNNYESAIIARHFSETLGEQINRSLNERRWAAVLDAGVKLQDRVKELHTGVEELRDGASKLTQGATQTASGAHKLARGNSQLNSTVTQLTSGVRQFSVGLKSIGQSLPSENDLSQLKTGAAALASAHENLAEGIGELKDGSQRLGSGVTTFRDETRDSFFVPSAVADGADQLASGISQIDNGLGTALNAQQQLAAGAKVLSTNVGALTDGMLALESGLNTAANRLPEDGQLDQLSTGAGGLASGSKKLSSATFQLASGSARLKSGIETLERAVPAHIQMPDGTPPGLAASVDPVFESATFVQNTGSGFAPNIISCALWLGAGVAAFLLNVRVLPRHAILFPAVAQFLGKILLPSGTVLMQALAMFATIRLILRIPLYDCGAVTVVLIASSLCFLLIVFSLARAFGDAGKGFAMVLLAVQIASSGGVLPVELSGRLFSDISPWLPMTWAIKAMRASMFGAFDAGWQIPLLILSGGSLLITIVGGMRGRWRFAHPLAIRPPLDL